MFSFIRQILLKPARSYVLRDTRFTHSGKNVARSSKTTVYYIGAVGVLAVGLSYAAVPLYRIFCQAYSYGGAVGSSDKNIEGMKKVKDRQITVNFNADIGSNMRWNFKPQQPQITVLPGETALAFYTARNGTDKPITGISTYNVVPFEAGQYFNKIQCFCFEEQLLNPHEEVKFYKGNSELRNDLAGTADIRFEKTVDMPVFFYIDPEFTEDPKMELVDTITLSYTFFEAKDNLKLPLPSYVKPHVK